jgi:hypothetical protein
MSNDNSLLQQRQELIEQIERLGPMRKGSVTEQMLPYKRKDGSQGNRGPYFTYTFKQGNKTKGKHLADEQEAQLYREQIDRFRDYQELSSRFVETSQALADAEAQARRGKKNSRTKSKKKSSAKSQR